MMKKHVFALLVLLALLCVSAACAEGEITALSQLNDPVHTIGVSTGSVSERTVTEELPLAKISYYNDKFLGYADVAAGKIDAFVYDLAQMKLSVQSGLQGVRLLTETLGQPVQIAVGISRVSRIPELTEKINRFLAEIRADGTLDGMYTRWVLSGDEALPEIEKPASPQGLLVVGTTGNVPPYSYYSGTQLTGYDIELAYRFAAWLGMDIAFEVMDFDAVVPAAQSGKVDCVMSNLQISPERQEGFQFSDILYEERQGVLVRGSDPTPAGLPGGDVYTALAQLDGKPIGVQTGSNFAEMVAERMPEATVEYYNGKPIFYSLGNFIFNQTIKSGGGGAVEFTIDENDNVSYRIIPIMASDAKTYEAIDTDANAYSYVESISENVSVDENGIISGN